MVLKLRVWYKAAQPAKWKVDRKYSMDGPNLPETKTFLRRHKTQTNTCLSPLTYHKYLTLVISMTWVIICATSDEVFSLTLGDCGQPMVKALGHSGPDPARQQLQVPHPGTRFAPTGRGTWVGDPGWVTIVWYTGYRNSLQGSRVCGMGLVLGSEVTPWQFPRPLLACPCWPPIARTQSSNI